MANDEIIEVENEAELVKASSENGCTPGEVCVAMEFFEMITQCKLCGRLC
jgi:hypothetical protein